LACEITAPQWAALHADTKLIWDVRSARPADQSPLDQAIRMSPASAGITAVSEKQTVLLVGDALDLNPALSQCADLRARGSSVFVLSGGDRAWRARAAAVTSDPLKRDAELTIAQAAPWLGDRHTEWINVDSSASAHSLSSFVTLNKSDVQRRIFLLPDVPSKQIQEKLKNAMDDHTWWVSAVQRDIEAEAQKLNVVAVQMGAPLQKPCGVN
jgi:hypothetical protein